MATFVKYNCFAGDMAGKVHDLLGTAGSGADTCKVILSNTAPNVSTHTVRADVTELSTANGYTSGGASIANVGTNSAGTFTLTGTDVVWTASGGSVGPFQYVILYNDTSTSDSLIGYWARDAAITLADGDTFTTDFGASILTHV